VINHAMSYPATRCRRLHQRLDVEDLGLAARVSVAGRAIEGVLRNISFGGCAVRIDSGTPGPAAFPGYGLSVLLPSVTTAEGTPLMAEATLVALENGVLHIQFHPLSWQARHALTRFVYELPRTRLLGKRSA
jgi:hypothetical protein